MAETTTLKRLREETPLLVDEEEEEIKRPRSSSPSPSYTQILSLLESEEEEPIEDLSSMISTLQKEISSSPQHNEFEEPNLNSNLLLPEPNNLVSDSDPDTSINLLEETSSLSSSSTDEEEDKERIMRHLLEASDDELGIPEIRYDLVEEEEIYDGRRNGFDMFDGLWEIEDETANYYTLLQSELFM